ncbi:gluconate 2-dehydrogenase subunit 3 family protein [Corallincola platygyrae]|uniref:Gluconate 2-dehydrogenase subunit 3 family protein n=1 Tax=Corallincola platygyrae TaxID=1193278 RepID=A0ABW4XHK2_9GAMM
MLKTEALKAGAQPEQKPEKNSKAVFQLGVSRREFLRSTTAVGLLAGLLATKPALAAVDGKAPDPFAKRDAEPAFKPDEKAVLSAVQMQLFPDDGDGPSAKDLHALDYLIWAVDDPPNLEEGDKAFIRRGIGWLQDLSNSKHGKGFVGLSTTQQSELMKQISQSQAGENWLSLLLYYLMEALTLDPVYGGNPDGIGWQWLKHQPGYPRPTKDTTYHQYV